MAFFLAVPKGIMCCVFGLTDDAPATLAPFRERFPDASMRLLVVSQFNAARVLDTAEAVVKRMPHVARWDIPGPVFELQRATEEGVQMMVDVVSAAAMGDLSESELPPFRATAPRTSVGASHLDLWRGSLTLSKENLDGRVEYTFEIGDRGELLLEKTSFDSSGRMVGKPKTAASFGLERK
jgi:hypothetical protein